MSGAWRRFWRCGGRGYRRLIAGRATGQAARRIRPPKVSRTHAACRLGVFQYRLGSQVSLRWSERPFVHDCVSISVSVRFGSWREVASSVAEVAVALRRIRAVTGSSASRRRMVARSGAASTVYLSSFLDIGAVGFMPQPTNTKQAAIRRFFIVFENFEIMQRLPITVHH